MKIMNVFDAVKEGTFDDFIKYYSGDINQVNKYTNLNLLETAVLNDKNPDDKLRIIKFLIEQQIDLNFVDDKYKRNALHTLYFNVIRGNKDFLLLVTKLLVDGGININSTDKYNAIPLKYAITVNKLKTEDMYDIYMYLLQAGSKYQHKDSLGKCCIDYANDYSWRNGFNEIVKEYEDDK